MLKHIRDSKHCLDCEMECHYALQSDYTHFIDYINNKTYQIVQYWIKNENLNVELIDLLNQFDNTKNTSNVNDIIASFDTNIGEKACTNLKITDLNRENIDLINEIYRKDFELFGYQMM